MVERDIRAVLDGLGLFVEDSKDAGKLHAMRNYAAVMALCAPTSGGRPRNPMALTCPLSSIVHNESRLGSAPLDEKGHLRPGWKSTLNEDLVEPAAFLPASGETPAAIAPCGFGTVAQNVLRH